jgi:uncharacterized GH25 family protein
MTRRIVHAVLIAMLASWASIAAGHDTWLRWRRQQRWRETYVKLAKTFVRVGQPTADQSWREPVGLALEIVPLADPSTLLVGSRWIEPSSSPDADWQSLFATLTVRVEPAP